MRKQINAAVIGTNGTGKTSYLIEIIRAYLRINKRVLVCVSDDAEEKLEDIPLIHTLEEIRNFKGVAKIIVEDVAFFDELREYFLNEVKEKIDGALILDDGRLFLSSRDESVLRLMRKRRQLNADVYSVFHAFDGETPPSYWGFVTRVIIFKTLSSCKRSIKLLAPEMQAEILQAIKEVDEEYKTNPYAKKQVILRRETD